MKPSITEITAKSLLRRYKRIDSWFISAMGMNIYRGCTHGCAYCDGRAETYGLTGVFGRNVVVKINAVELLKKELDLARKRKPFPNGFVMVGGGVSDAWQPIDKTYRLTQGILETLLAANLSVHALTKSDQVVESIPILKEINAARRAVVSFSFSSVDEEISRIVEPGLPGPTHRLAAMEQIKAAGIGCGMFLMPVVPGVTDTEPQLTRSLEAAKQVGADYVVFGGMTLKPGRQLDHFISLVQNQWPDLVPGYQKIFPGNRWGAAVPGYYDKIQRRLTPIARALRIPLRIPDTIFGDLLDETAKVVVILEHLDYLTRLTSPKSFFGLAAKSILNARKEIRELWDLLPSMRGIGPFTLEIIKEICDTGTSRYYRNLIGL